MTDHVSDVFGTGEISTSDQFLNDIIGFIRVHKDGQCERFKGNNPLPAGVDSLTGVESKDVIISPESNLTARLYIPKTTTTDQKLPIMIYFHGGGFVFETAKSSNYQPLLHHFTTKLKVIIVSVDYRLGPEFPVPTGYNDSWEAIRWVASHSAEGGPDPWLNKYANFSKVYLAGDSAGANISHNMAIRFGSDRVAGINLEGVILLHPYFGGTEPMGSELGIHKKLKVFTDQFWNLANPSETGLDDPLFNPWKNVNVSGFGCSRILLAVAEKDTFRDRGLYYKELIEKSGWVGKLEIIESKEVDHVFFLADLSSKTACTLFDKICTFINQINN